MEKDLWIEKKTEILWNLDGYTDSQLKQMKQEIENEQERRNRDMQNAWE